MACQIGINLLVKEKTKDKPWFKYEEDKNFIQILESPAKKITKYNIGGVAKSIANSLNKALNKEYEVGNVFYPIKNDQIVGVQIKPSIKQLEVLNAKDAQEAEKIRQELLETNPELVFKEDVELSEQLRLEQEEKEFSVEDLYEKSLSLTDKQIEERIKQCE